MVTVCRLAKNASVWYTLIVNISTGKRLTKFFWKALSFLGSFPYKTWLCRTSLSYSFKGCVSPLKNRDFSISQVNFSGGYIVHEISFFMGKLIIDLPVLPFPTFAVSRRKNIHRMFQPGCGGGNDTDVFRRWGLAKRNVWPKIPYKWIEMYRQKMVFCLQKKTLLELKKCSGGTRLFFLL